MISLSFGYVTGCACSSAWEALHGRYSSAWVGIMLAMPGLLVLSFVSQ